MATERNVCPRCGGVGYYVDEATNTTHRCDCGRRDTLEYNLRLEKANIPRRFAKHGFETFKVGHSGQIGQDLARVKDAAQAYAQSATPELAEGLILRGATGCGKTHLAVAILKEVMRAGLTGYFTSFINLLDKIRHSYHPDFPVTEEEVLRPLEESDFLVLDDVGAEAPKDFVRDRLFLIVNRRYEAAKPLLITTNCDAAELEARVGKRTASRLEEMCGTPFPRFPAMDFRDPGTKEKLQQPASKKSGDRRRDLMY